MCTIGGNVAENSGGAHCLKYGFTVHHVTGLTFVLPDGDVVELGGKALDPDGPDLLGVVVGSEGTLGIATRITLRVVRAPQAVRTLLAGFQTMDAAGAAVSGIVAAGVLPSAIEMMDRLTIEAAERAVAPGYPDGRRRRAPRRARRRRRAGRGRRGRGRAHLRRVRRVRAPRRLERGRPRAALEGAQVGIRRDGADRDRLLRAGRRRPAHAAARGAASRSRSCRSGTACASATSSTPGTATSIRSSSTTRRRARPSARASSPRRSSRPASTRAARSRASTASGWTRRARCRGCSPSETSRSSSASDTRSIPLGICNPGKVIPTPRLCGEVPGPYRVHALERIGVAERL